MHCALNRANTVVSVTNKAGKCESSLIWNSKDRFFHDRGHIFLNRSLHSVVVKLLAM